MNRFPNLKSQEEIDAEMPRFIHWFRMHFISAETLTFTLYALVIIALVKWIIS